MFDNKLLKPFNQCPYTAYEKQVKSSHKDVTVYKDNKGAYRLLYSDCFGFVSGILVAKQGKEKHYTIKGVYSLQEYRNKGYARSLLLVARQLLKDVRHSEHLTESGKGFARLLN